MDLSKDFIKRIFCSRCPNVDQHTGRDYTAAIKTIFKEGDHLRIGAIVSGQSPMTQNYPGFHKADFNNVVDIHLGNNVKDYLVNSNEISGTTDLSIAYGKLLAYCSEQNESIAQVDKRYRFALVSIPQQPLFFQEIPFLGANGFDAEHGGPDYDFQHFNCDEFPANVTDLDSAVQHHRRALATSGLSRSGQSSLVHGLSTDLGQKVQLSPQAIAPSNLVNLSTVRDGLHGLENPLVQSNLVQNHPIGGAGEQSAICPQCQVASTKIKSKGENGKARFYCKNGACSKATFTVDLVRG